MNEQDSIHYDAVIADLEAQREKLWSIIVALKQLKKLGMPFDKVSAVATHQPNALAVDEGVPVVIPHDAFFGMKVPDAARTYLSMVRHTKPHPELCDALLAGGFKTNAANFREVVRSTLGRQPDFVKINGQWGLKEWYGSRATKRRSRRTTTESEDKTQVSTSEAQSESEGKNE